MKLTIIFAMMVSAATIWAQIPPPTFNYLPQQASDPTCAALQYWLVPVTTSQWRMCFNGTITNVGSGSGSGTVTSVGLTGSGTLFSATPGTAVTTSGTLNVDAQLQTQAANCLVAGPASGAAATPTCRAQVAADIPLLSQSLISFRTATDHVVGQNSSVEAIAYSSAVTPSSLTSAGKMHIHIAATSTTTGGDTCTFKVYLNTSNAIAGGTVIALTGALSSGSPRNVDFDIDIWARSATNSQLLNYSFITTTVVGSGHTTAAIDMTGTPWVVISGTSSVNNDPVGCTVNAADGIITK